MGKISLRGIERRDVELFMDGVRAEVAHVP